MNGEPNSKSWHLTQSERSQIWKHTCVYPTTALTRTSREKKPAVRAWAEGLVRRNREGAVRSRRDGADGPHLRQRRFRGHKASFRATRDALAWPLGASPDKGEPRGPFWEGRGDVCPPTCRTLLTRGFPSGVGPGRLADPAQRCSVPCCLRSWKPRTNVKLQGRGSRPGRRRAHSQGRSPRAHAPRKRTVSRKGQTRQTGMDREKRKERYSKILIFYFVGLGFFFLF